jgi:hypothetical protein
MKNKKEYANYVSEQVAKQIKDDEEKGFVMVHSFGQLKDMGGLE